MILAMLNDSHLYKVRNDRSHEDSSRRNNHWKRRGKSTNKSRLKDQRQTIYNLCAKRPSMYQKVDNCYANRNQRILQ